MFLVTGGCGFIGSHLVDHLLQKGYRVRVLDDLSNSTTQYLAPEVEFINGSISNEPILKQALKGIDGVFHLAALVSVSDSVTHWYRNHLINCSATVRLFELLKKKPIVFASSAAVYGEPKSLPHKEDIFPTPLSPYAADKFANELHAKVAWHLFQTPSVACRFFNVYGPRQNPSSPYAGVISKFADSIVKREAIQIFGDGKQFRDFIYVQDVVNMLLRAMETLQAGAKVYNFCTGKTYTIDELADLLGKVLGMSVQKEYLPALPGDTLQSQGDPSTANQELHIKAQIPLEEGLRLLLT